jgi:hypothetical protein
MSNATLRRASSPSRDGSLLVAADLHLVGHTPSIGIFSDRLPTPQFRVLGSLSLVPAVPPVEVEEDIYDGILSSKQVCGLGTPLRLLSNRNRVRSPPPHPQWGAPGYRFDRRGQYLCTFAIETQSVLLPLCPRNPNEF